MAFWIREIIGWLLVVLGLLLFWFCLGFLSDHRVIEGGVAASVGAILFRGGIHLIKVATAARVLLADPSDRGQGLEARSQGKK